MNGLTRYTIGATDYYEVSAVDQEISLYRNEVNHALEITAALRSANVKLATYAAPPSGWKTYGEAWEQRALAAEAKVNEMATAAAVLIGLIERLK